GAGVGPVGGGAVRVCRGSRGGPGLGGLLLGDGRGGGVRRRGVVGRLGRGLGGDAGRCLSGLRGLRGDGLLGGGALLLDLGLLEQLLLPLGQRLGIDGRDVLLAAGGLGVTLL